MSTHEQIAHLRGRVSLQLTWLQELAVVRNQLLNRAAEDRHPAVARALRTNRETADAVRKALRLARAELEKLETSRAPDFGRGQ
jgi:hypothetical protein